MADGNLVRQSNVGKGSVVFGPSVYDVPLLPYEKQLIETIGITEEEYRRFTAEVRRRGVIRPAEYAHIPDIQASGAEPYLIGLAISLVVTGVGYLLTPKPKMPGAQKEGGIINLDGVTGASRFTPSRGFDSLAELATYASAVPIIFGLRRKGVGGMLVTPKMVWSRMFSHGTMQQAKLMFVVGEQGIESDGIAPPDLGGIFLGNNALEPFFREVFAFYWKSDSSIRGRRRIRNIDLLHGTSGEPGTGDPDAKGGDNKAVFVAPTEDDITDDKAFCHSFSPANNSQFGVYSPIASGTGYRVNYRVISIPEDQGKKARRFQALSRIKIVGDRNLLADEEKSIGDNGDNKFIHDIIKQNQSGAGRNYSPRMGLVKLTRRRENQPDLHFTVSDDLIDGRPRLGEGFRVKKDDRLTFLISPTQIPEDFYKEDGKGESVEEINSVVETAQIAADEALQKGERFEIGGCIYVVERREPPQKFDPTANVGHKYILKCISVDESLFKRVGLVSKKYVVNPPRNYIGDSPEDKSDGSVNNSERVNNIPEDWYPLTRFTHATIRNNRPAVSTEIGIKSVVNQRLNGLCAFSSLPTPSQIGDYDEDNFQVNTGTINAFIPRTTLFRVFVRDPEKSAKFRAIPRLFAIRGETPVAQYNFIRFVNHQDIGDDGAARLEFKIFQVSGSEARLIPGKSEIIELTHTASPEPGLDRLFSEDVRVNRLGRMTIVTAGRKVPKRSLHDNKEFFRSPSFTPGETTLTYPDGVRHRRQLPDPQAGTIATALDKRRQFFSNLDTRVGAEGALTEAIAGNSDTGLNGKLANKSVKIVYTKEYPIAGNASRWISLRWQFKKKNLPDNHYARQNGKTTYWKLKRVTVQGSSIGFNKNQLLNFKRGIQATDVLSGQTTYSQQNNSFVPNHPDGTLTYSGARFKVINDKTIDEVKGRNHAYLYEVFGNPEFKSEGHRKTVTIALTKGSKTIQFKLKSSVKKLSKEANEFFGRKNTWDKPSIDSVLESGTTQDWEVDEKFNHFKTIPDSNPFKTVYNESGIQFQIASRKADIEDDEVSSSLRFARRTQISDISFYRQLVEKSNSSQPEHEIVYINEIQENKKLARFDRLTLAGLSLKAGRSFTRLDQLRVYLKSGIPVERLHPKRTQAYGDNALVGPSNLLTDLFYYLMTNQDGGGAGALLGQSRRFNYLIDKEALVKTSRFLFANRLFFNGPITDRSNLRQLMMDLAPSFLCNLVITDGKFALKPALPHKSGGSIETGPIQIEQLFTSGNILEDTFKIEYLGAEERRLFKAVVRFRQETVNQLPEEKAITVRGLGAEYRQNHVDPDNLPLEQFDLTQFCTSQDHAELVAKYFLALRKLVTHTISFSTTCEGLSIQAGSFIKVITESSPYSSANNGTISASGVVTSVDELDDGEYNVDIFQTDSEQFESDQKIRISNGRVTQSKFHDSIFSVIDRSVSENIYVVEQLTFSEEGTVDIVASEHPCDDDGSSKLVDSILNDNFDVD